MPVVTSEDLKTARDSLPENLRNVPTARWIQALITYTKRASETRLNPISVEVIIPPEDLEPLLVSGFVRFENLEPTKHGRNRVVVENGQLRKG